MSDDRILFWSKGPEEWRFLSAFDERGFNDRNIYYKTVEHWYQANKCYRADEFRRVVGASTPQEAKRLGKGAPADLARESSLNAMYDGYQKKFAAHPKLARKLMETGDRELVHFAPWGDTYWGVGKDMQGENQQGKVLMRIRSDLQKAHRAALDEISARPKVVCGTYGCTNLKPEGFIFCETCQQDYRDDPEAFK